MSSLEKNPSEEANRLGQKANVLREDLDGIVGELDRRRHRLTRRLQPAALIAAGALVAGGVGFAFWRRHRLRTRPRLAPFRDALRRMAAHPDRVAKETPSVPKKVAAATLTTLASLVVKRAFAAALR
jgi:hypothetical protein